MHDPARCEKGVRPYFHYAWCGFTLSGKTDPLLQNCPSMNGLELNLDISNVFSRYTNKPLR